jgi:hypothetical protein
VNQRKKGIFDESDETDELVGSDEELLYSSAGTLE